MTTRSNPYARFLEGRDGASLVSEFPPKLQAVMAALGNEGISRRLGAGKWTTGEILCHLADTEIAFSFRWRQVLAEDGHVIQTFDQDLWAPRYSLLSGEQALGTLLALRAWNVAMLQGLPASAWDRQAMHPELGGLTFRTMVEIMAGHDLHHLAQLTRLAQGEGA